MPAMEDQSYYASSLVRSAMLESQLEETYREYINDLKGRIISLEKLLDDQSAVIIKDKSIIKTQSEIIEMQRAALGSRPIQRVRMRKGK